MFIRISPNDAFKLLILSESQPYIPKTIIYYHK